MDWTAPISGFVLGFIGSLHCLGMCGPIVLVLPAGGGGRSPVWGRLLYNLGRTTTYTALGLVFGFSGAMISFVGLQQPLGIIIGSMMILLGLFPRLSSMAGRWVGSNQLWPQLGGWMSQRMGRPVTPAGLYIIGLLNGLLPCGLVYAAIAASIAMGSAIQGGVLMAAFGLGTTPALFLLAIFGIRLSASIQLRFRRWAAVAMIALGALFVLRGMALGIPYLSPSSEMMKMHHPHQTVDPHQQDPH